MFCFHVPNTFWITFCCWTSCNLFPTLFHLTHLGMLCALWDIHATVVRHIHNGPWLMCCFFMMCADKKLSFSSATCVCSAMSWLLHGILFHNLHFHLSFLPLCMTHLFICTSLKFSCIFCPPSPVLYKWILYIYIWFNACVPMLPFVTFAFIFFVLLVFVNQIYSFYIILWDRKEETMPAKRRLQSTSHDSSFSGESPYSKRRRKSVTNQVCMVFCQLLCRKIVIFVWNGIHLRQLSDWSACKSKLITEYCV